MEHILGVTRKYKCTDIDLTVNQENLTAINFYEKLGMKIKNIKYSTIIWEKMSCYDAKKEK